MTQSPYVGRTAPPGAASGTAPQSTDFGATTVSGTPVAPAAGSQPAEAASNGYAAPSIQAPPASVAAAVPAPPRPAATNGVARGSGQGGTGTNSRVRGPRRARLQLRNINPWTVLKFSCILSIALFFVWLIVIGLLFGILDATGVIGKINDTVTTINGDGSKDPVTAGIVFGGAAIIGVVEIVLFIALATVGSVIYNLCADLVGGVEVTLSEG